MKKLLLFITGLIIWFFFAGSFSWPLLITGLLVSLIAAFLFGEMTFRFYKTSDSFKMVLTKIFYTFIVVITFIYDAYLSALKVSFHSFEPNPSFNPGIVKIKTHLKNITGITVLSNLITLTPGTLVLDFDVLNRFYYIHWIDVSTEEEARIKKEVIGRHELWIAKIFELDSPTKES